jgi:Tfp pilus assembly protein PilX
MNGRWEKKKCPAKAGRYEEQRRVFEQPAGDRGFALVFTLLVLGMMSLIALAMVLSSSSDMMINGYYRNARGSFYAADSGLSIARQQLLDQTIAQVPPAFGPIATNAAATALNTVTTMYSSSTSLNAGQAGNSWTESFVILNTTACPTTFSIAPNQPTITATSSTTGLPTGYQYIYNYNICVMGTAEGSEQTTVSENGSFILSIAGQQISTKTSFSIFGGWVGSYPDCLGPLVPGTMTGPMFTNNAWEFMTGGVYIFTDPVGQAEQNADFWIGGCIPSPTSSYTSGNQTIKPIFEGDPPFSLGQPTQPSPTDSFSQKWAVLDGEGYGETNSSGQVNNPQANPPTTAQPTQTDMNGVLKDISGTPYPSGGATTGVFMPYSCVGSPCTNTLSGGGIYVEGSASVVMSIGNDTSAAQNPIQTYTITQGSTTTTITTDPGANTTTVQQSGKPTLTLAGVPTNCSTMLPLPPLGACTSGVAGSAPGTVLYVNGTITSLSGTGQAVPTIQNGVQINVPAAVQDGAQIAIVANGNIDITGDVVYKTEPVTVSDNQSVLGSNPACCIGDPVSTLIPGYDKNEVLGIFTANGNINLMSPYANNNLQVDGSLAPLQSGQFWCFTCTGFINTFNNVGGQIQSGICGCDMNTENTYFDRRFTARAGFGPPWFPATTIATTGTTSTTTITPTVQHVQWLLKNM